MRVTQSMLSNNFLRNVSNSYGKLGKLQDQLASQKKITRPSDDPVVAMLGLGYRTELNRVQQFSRNIGEVNNWLDSTDDAITHGVKVLQRIRELVVQASNGTYEESQREAIAVEVKELKEQLKTIGNTQVGGKYIFNGDKTNERPDGEFSDGEIQIEVFSGITIPVNTSGKELFGDLLTEDDPSTAVDESGTLARLIATLEDPDATDEEIGNFLGEIDGEIDRFLKIQAEVGAKQNRVEMMEDRIASQEVIATKILSENEDIDMEKVITELITQESIHRAALSVGARIIQPTLMDFLR
ncbi:flagellar hook-associated protein FlgL [Fervidibacillus halotolerans]|uniref:Flagellar hook-associated protein FlgL n=1 Tax=Fervidibacillus halotolerans TaxID=2980027 RepID=A0A9E8LZU3_9BACI|nr:flagellar hook-associated protein FlgL [Fervidibacillus halotolerans]WAA12026.1 flagellar hook-associated protein FlgL [Fervidibacillus halotolerans]